MNDYDHDPLLLDALDDSAEAPARFWTRGRVIYALIALLMILALLAYTLWPLLLALTQPMPVPPTPPLPLNVI